MNFIVKDLMITVLPERFDIGKLAGCGACSSDSSGPPCSGICPGSKNPIPALQEVISAADNPVTLAILREQLKQQLAAIDKRVVEVRDNIVPLTDADKENLSNRLGSAIRELGSSSAPSKSK